MRPAKVFSVMNRKGGVGKTTTAITLAHGLGRLIGSPGPEVLIIDLDPQGNVASSLGVNLYDDDHTLTEVVLGQIPAEEAIISAKRDTSNVWLIPADDSLTEAKVNILSQDFAQSFSKQLAGARIKKEFKPQSPFTLQKWLGHLAKTFSYIILDCPPSLDFMQEAIYYFTDLAIVPVKPDYLGTRGTAQHTADIIQAQEDGSAISIECFVPTFYRSREIVANMQLDDLIRYYGRDKVSAPIPQVVAFEQATAAGGQTILDYAPDSPAALAYMELANRIWRKYRV